MGLNLNYWIQKARYHEQTGSQKEAIHDLSCLLLLCWNCIDALEMRAHLYRANNEVSKAEEDEKVLELILHRIDRLEKP